MGDFVINVLSKILFVTLDRDLYKIIVYLVILLITIIFIGIYSKKWKWLINRRVIMRIIISGVIFFLSNLVLEYSLYVAISGWSVSGFLIIIAFFFNKYSIFPENLIISYLKKIYNNHDLDNCDEFSNKKPFFALSIPSKVEYLYIIAQNLMNLGNFYGAYKIYLQIDELPLFDDERSRLKVLKAQLFSLIGDINSAENLLSEIDLQKYTDLIQNSKFVFSLIEEQKGNFNKANELLNEALEYEDSNYIILNNIGRMKFFRGNKLEQLRYYERAFKHKSTGKSSEHIVYKNLIDSLLLNCKYKEAASKFKEYEQKFSEGTFLDRLSFVEYKISYGRQTKNRKLILEAIATMLFVIMPNLPEKKQLQILISALRIVNNLPTMKPVINVKSIIVTLPDVHVNQTQLLTLLFSTKLKWSEIQSLNFKERFLINKEIMTILERITSSNLITPFKDIERSLEDFFINSLNKIDKVITETDKHFVYDIWKWEKNLLYARRFLQRNMRSKDLPNYIEKTISILKDLKKELVDRGAFISSLEAELDLIDEIISLIPAIKDKKKKKIFIKNATEEIITTSEKMLNIERKALSADYYLRMAFYSMKLQKPDLCKKNYKAFLDSGISVHHYSNWIRKYAGEVEHFLFS